VAETINLKVGNITCMDCVTHIAAAAKRVGAQKVSGNVTQRTVKIVYEPVRVDLAAIIQAIEAAGYRVESTV
jgi:copper chaperone CopZ